jgi:hypothetical protein
MSTALACNYQMDMQNLQSTKLHMLVSKSTIARHSVLNSDHFLRTWSLLKCAALHFLKADSGASINA